jgi:type II secretory pathway component PulF
LTVTVLIVFIRLVLAALFLLVLPRLATLLSGLAALLALSELPRLTALLALSDLVTLLPFLLHIICHKNTLLEKREQAALLRFKRHLTSLVAARYCKVGKKSSSYEKRWEEKEKGQTYLAPK